MPDVSYVPGPLTAVTGDQYWVLVEASPDSPAVTRIWQQLGQGVAADALLVGLLADGAVPGFALLTAATDGEYRLFCRGAVAAAVVGAGDGEGKAAAQRVAGAGLLTWREHVVGSAGQVVLGEPPADTAPRLPATSGVLLAGSVIIDFTNLAERQSRPNEPERASEPPNIFPATITVPPADGDGGHVPAGSGSVPASFGSPPVSVPPPPVAEPAPGGNDFAAGVSDGPDPGNDGETDGEYDFFWSETLIGAVEDAAIRGPGDGGPLSVMPPDLPPPTRLRQGGDGPVQLGATPPGSLEPGSLEPGAPLPGPDVPRWPDAPGGSAPTVKRGDVPGPAPRTAPPDRIGPVVPALVCPDGHLNPPSGTACRRCGASLPQDPVLVPRPVLGVLRLSTGDVISLDRGVIMGRSPSVDSTGPHGFGGSDGEERPHVIKLSNSSGQVSRTHLRVALDGWRVLVTDLNSTNGTLAALPGGDPEPLQPGEPTAIQPGTVVTLAEGIDFRYEVTD